VHSAGELLASQAKRAGYGAVTLTLIAEATLPGYARDVRRDIERRLSDRELAQVTDAVDTLAQAGLQAGPLQGVLRSYQARYGENWRQPFWARALQRASLHYNTPERYGLSPLEQDPVRLARFGPAPIWGTPGVA
jgi:hypothetical protein